MCIRLGYWAWLCAFGCALAAAVSLPAVDTLAAVVAQAPPVVLVRDVESAREALNAAENLQKREEFAAAQAWLDRLHEWIEAQATVEPTLRAYLLVLESRQHVQAARPEPARLAALAAVELLDAGGDSIDLARAQAQLAVALRSGDRRSEALAASDRAAALYERTAPDSNAALWALASRVGIQRTNGQFDAANATLAELESRLSEDNPDIELRASATNLRAVSHLLASELPAAVRALSRAVELLQQVPHASTMKAVVQLNLGLAAWDLGDLGSARTQLRAAVAAERRLRPGTLQMARATINLARLNAELGEWTDAADGYAQAETIVLKLAAGQPVEAYLRSNQAELAAAQGRNDEARALFQRAVTVNEKQPRDCYCVGPTLRDYAWFLGSTGQAGAREGIGLLRRVRALLDAFENRDIESFLLDRQEAELRLASGELNVAADLAARARKGLAGIAPQSANHALALHTEGLVARAQGRAEAARASLCAAVEVLERVDVGDGVLTDSRFRARHADLYHACSMARADAGDAAGALDVLEQGRARSLLSLWRGNAAALDGEPQAAVDAWIDYRQQRTAAAARAADPEQSREAAATARRELESLDARHAAELARLDSAAPRTAALLVPRSGSGHHRQLPADALLLAYSVGSVETLVLQASADGVVSRRIPLGRAALAEEVAGLRAAMLARTSDGLPALQHASAALHTLLLAPHADAIARSKRLLVLADGPLQQLPFAALYRSDFGRYLVEDTPIVQVESLGALALEQRSATHARARRALVVADPVAADAAVSGLPALPGALAEAGRVHRTLGRSAILLRGAAASETRVRREAGAAGLLHFAVHGVLDDAAPLDSALILGRDAHADGALSVREILGSMRLSADIVVLSACNTAVDAEARGDGLVSLTRAFRQAGAARVVATLWPIADQGAAELMARFHRALAAGAPADAALREAQLALMRTPTRAMQASVERGVGGLAPRGEGLPADLSHPFYWSGFQLYGRPEDVRSRHSSLHRE